MRCFSFYNDSVLNSKFGKGKAIILNDTFKRIFNTRNKDVKMRIFMAIQVTKSECLMDRVCNYYNKKVIK